MDAIRKLVRVWRTVKRTIAGVVLTGCASSGTSHADIDPMQFDGAFSTEERSVILDANARWDAVAYPWSGDGWRIEIGTPPPGENGWCDPVTRTITIPQHMRDPKNFPILVTHELGHARGLGHTCEDGVMQKCEGWSGPSSPTITAGDIAECRRVQACP